MSGIKTNRQRGFTIVELLIVIVVIAILATISIIGYNGIQKRARDAQRETAISTITKALEMYHIDNGGYPKCGGGTYRPGEVRVTCTTDNIGVAAALVPKYMSKVPQDPAGGGAGFVYMAGSKKVSDTTYSGGSDDNYLMVIAFESRSGPYVTNWGSPYNYFSGSSN